MKVPFVNLHIKHVKYLSAFENKLRECIDTNDFILGKNVRDFEDAFAQYVGSSYAVGVASGTEALHLSLRANQVKPGDEILVPAMTFAATAFAVLAAEAKPIPVDVHDNTGLINLEDAEKAITQKTKAIIPVHLYGLPCDMNAIKSFAQKHNLVVVEDACQAHGAMIQNQRVGTFGEAGCFSFFPGKNLGALGDGGMVVTNDEKIYKQFLMLRNYGQSKRYHHDSLGFNSRLDSLQAAFLNEKLKNLDQDNSARQKHAAFYRKNFSDLPLELMEAPSEEISHVYHLFVVRTSARDQLMQHLSQRGIQTGIHYPVPIHEHNFMKQQAAPCRNCPVAKKLADEVLSLPMFPELKQEELDSVVAAVKEFFK